MKIILAAGGSGGPVAPLLAVAKQIQHLHGQCEFLLVGTQHGPEREMALTDHIPFTPIVSGKFRRYFSWLNFFSPFLVVVGFFQAVNELRKFKPNIVLGSGSFVQVPVVWAAWVLRIPILLHQQDLYPSLANKLCSLMATKITVTFENSIRDFSQSVGIIYKRKPDKVVQTGNPFREELSIANKYDAIKSYDFSSDLPTIFITGGGTGAVVLNKIVEDSLPELLKFAQVIHSTGAKKQLHFEHPRYRQYEFITDMAIVYAAADIVVSRAGLSTITELSNLEKISIIIPMPNSHQELNGVLLSHMGGAVVVEQQALTPNKFIQLIRSVLFDSKLQNSLKNNIGKLMPKHSAKKIAEIAISLAAR